MPTLFPGKTIGEVAAIIHAAVVVGPAAWGRERMPEAHMSANIEEKLKSQLINLFRILHESRRAEACNDASIPGNGSLLRDD